MSTDARTQDAGAQDDIKRKMDHAIGLLNQQLWCWGRDVLRPEGNWLIEIGFERLSPPIDRKECSSVYVLELPGESRILLRGFGVFYGERRRGGVFLPRYEFSPAYTESSKLDCPPWRKEDLPELKPAFMPNRNLCASLVLSLMDWIGSYELMVTEKLGVEYRRRTLEKWNNGKNRFTPAEKMAAAWRELSLQLAANTHAYLGPIEP